LFFASAVVDFALCFELTADLAADLDEEVFFLFGFDTVFLGGASLRTGFVGVSAEIPGVEYVPAPKRATANKTNWARRRRGELVIFYYFR
jgi:hypothetical protein